MISFFKKLLYIILLAQVAATVRAAPLPAANDSLVVVAGESLQTLVISDLAILEGTDSLTVNGVALRRDQDYAVDYSSSRAILARPLSKGDTLKVSFYKLPFRISEPQRYLPPAAPRAAGDTTSYGIAAVGSALPDWLADKGSGLRMWGNKSLAVVVGSGRDLSVEQALQVSINGRVGQNLELNAYLSDQEMPLSTTGSTQELDQLDRVFLQAKTPEWQVTMGDYDVSLEGFELLGADRQAKGASAGIDRRNIKASAFTAVAKGRSATLRFPGLDGVQGPYLLTSGLGRAPAPVLPNSEKVWLDGQLLRRGEAEDYIMDYPQAKLTFTPRRPITSDSRIMVDFQYSEEEFRRSLYGGSLSLGLASGLSLGMGYLSDGDDPDRPLLQTLDDRQQALLGLAGDDTSKLWIDGGSPSDSGDYSLVDSIYVYVGQGGGYRVTFTWRGAGQGDYSYQPLLGHYVYVGPGQGDYVARARLPSPQRQQIMALSPRLEWQGGRVKFEGAWSRNDINLASSLDDGDNEGRAWCYQAGWSRDSLPWGGFRWSSQAMNVQQNFWTGAARARPDLSSEWGLSSWQELRQLNPLMGRRSHQHEFSYWPGRPLRVGGGYGILRMADSLRAERLQLWSTISPIRGWEATYRRQTVGLWGPWFLITGDGGSRLGQRVDSRLESGPYQIEAGASENQDVIRSNREQGIRTQEAWAGLRRFLGLGSLGSSFRRQEEARSDSLDGHWGGQWYVNEWRNDLRLKPKPSTDVGLEHYSRVKHLRPGVVGQGVATHLGTIRLSTKPWRQTLMVVTDYSLSFTQVQQKREEYYLVPSGTGQYSYDPSTGIFFPDTAGNYLRRILDEGPSVGTTEVSFRGSASFDPSLSFDSSWWSRTKLEISAQARVASYRPVTLRLLGFAPSRLWDRQGNASSLLDLSGDAWYRMDPWSHRLRLRWRQEDDNQFLDRHSRQSRLERSWQGWYQASSRVRLGLEAESQTVENSTIERGLESRISPLRLTAELVHQASRELELSFKVGSLREKVERSYRLPGDFRVVFREESGEAGAVKQLGMSGSLRLWASAIRRTADRPEQEIAAEYSYTRPLGWTGLYRAQYEHRLNRNLTATASYEARDEPKRRASHNGRMEIRAYF